jgi:hypothetical protein
MKTLENEQVEHFQEPNPQLTGHIFPNPVDSSAFMALLW